MTGNSGVAGPCVKQRQCEGWLMVGLTDSSLLLTLSSCHFWWPSMRLPWPSLTSQFSTLTIFESRHKSFEYWKYILAQAVLDSLPQPISPLPRNLEVSRMKSVSLAWCDAAYLKIPAIKRPRPEDCKLGASLSYIVTPYLKRIKLLSGSPTLKTRIRNL